MLNGSTETARERWWAIDPFRGHPLELRKWFSRMKEIDQDGDLKISITSAKRFSPTALVYTKSNLYTDFYNGYFVDLIQNFKDEIKLGTELKL